MIMTLNYSNIFCCLLRDIIGQGKTVSQKHTIWGYFRLSSAAITLSNGVPIVQAKENLGVMP